MSFCFVLFWIGQILDLSLAFFIKRHRNTAERNCCSDLVWCQLPTSGGNTTAETIQSRELWKMGMCPNIGDSCMQSWYSRISISTNHHNLANDSRPAIPAATTCRQAVWALLLSSGIRNSYRKYTHDMEWQYQNNQLQELDEASESNRGGQRSQAPVSLEQSRIQ